MKHFLNNFIDFFIKDKSSLSSEIIYQARTISLIFVITSFLSFVMMLLQLFGHFQGEVALPLTIFCVSILLLMKYYGNLKLVSYLFLLGGIIIIVLNINVTGQIYSYNQKWFLLILILSSFSAPKLTLPILIFSCFFQVYSYSSTSFVIQGIASKEEFLYDNISFFIICYLGIVIFNKLKLIQQSRIDTQNSQLRKQQNDLKESNRLLQQRSEQLLES